jgi:large subunit ribosomal protein L21
MSREIRGYYMIATIQTGGKQYRVQKGDRIKIEKLAGDVGSSVKFTEVLLVEGDALKVGAPYIQGATVEGTILAQDKDAKINVTKFKRRKGYHKTQGHRQLITRVEISAIHA